MKSFSQDIVKKFGLFKAGDQNKVGKFFLKLGISANMMTTFALIVGLVSVYFLFSNHLSFIILAVVHLLADGLDGLIAKASQPTKFGQYFDLISDRTIAFLVLLKVALHLQDYYSFIIFGLYVLTQLIYFSTKLEAPVVFIRTATIIVATVYVLYGHLLIVGYLIAGVFIVYSLALQLQWFVKKMFT